MIRIAWSNLRSASGRLSAAMIAIAVSVAFIVAALLFSQAFGDTLRNQVRAEWAGADVAVTATGPDDPAAADDSASSPLTESLTKTVAEVDGVESAQLTQSSFVSVSSGATSVTGSATNLPQGHVETIGGAVPTAADELMLREADAKTLGAGVGDTISLDEIDGAGRPSGDGPSYTVSGIMPGSSAAGMNLYLTDGGLKTAPGELMADSIRIVADDGSDRTALAEAVESALADTGDEQDVTVQTVDQVVDEQMESLSDGSDILSTIGIAFGLLAAGVAALVISNTFNVLVASRIRVLALFRAVGASRRQVRGAAVVESLSLGIVGSVLGVGLGLLIGWGLSTLVRALWMPEFAQMSLTPAAFIVGPVVGILVTLAAGLIPAIRASRVSPIEAMRPVDVPAAAPRIRWVRLTLALVLGIAGIGLCLLGTTSHNVLAGIAGCFALFVALLIGARVFVPPLVALLAGLVGLFTRRSPAVKLAGRSASTAGRRTASTTGALLIGVTLVTAVVVGSASLQRTLELATAADTPVDLVVSAAGSGSAGESSAEGIGSVLDDSPIVEDRVSVPAPTASVTVEGTKSSGDLAIASAEAAADSPVMRSDGYDVDEGTILVDPSSVGVDDDSDVDSKTALIRLGGQDIDLTIQASYDVPAGTALVSGADAKTIDAAAGGKVQEQTWTKVADDASTSQIEALTSELGASGATSDASAAQTRAEFASMFQVALTVVLGLLAAAVVIAVIGVSNTLTLSVIDRRREGALLRALGFTRSAMSRMITIESLLMTLIALVAGAGVGTFYGWVGTASLMPASADPVLSVPWAQIGLIGVAAVLAAVLASAIPARSMSRIAPAKGMSME
ncbi:putative ABC transport system permease protein [Brevibacterium iodinum ATCC 49514]|uniref:Putative ABC transport system permease protein n=1 Tax=Brevibacterium iodinum ATCC 49514 TaxID=1255616 RepID=A0A2H1J8A6_9MICO|nr:ABC transporter permease [Brevibacterium iodinum]SMX83747.1 putative ABC transport system permease protein [Brevibacterium iodinum ATCC 49514]SUW11157.1 macrolide transporter ATP-binding /permease protein [Brevibacterium iodinum]